MSCVSLYHTCNAHSIHRTVCGPQNSSESKISVSGALREEGVSPSSPLLVPFPLPLLSVSLFFSLFYFSSTSSLPSIFHIHLLLSPSSLSSRLATLVTNGVVASVLNRPSSKAVRYYLTTKHCPTQQCIRVNVFCSVSASVAGMEMRGIPHPDLGDDPTLILSTVTSDLSSPLVTFQLELNPLESEFDLDLCASLRPLQITYDAVSH